MRFEFGTATRILFGPGVVAEVAGAAAALGRRALVVTGRGVERSGSLVERLNTRNVGVEILSVAGEPTIQIVRAGVQRAGETQCDLVVGIGGGSVVDAGKAIAALLANGGDPLNYLEVIGRGQALTKPSAPYVAIPTTAGTGAEVTRNAVLAVPEQRLKASLRSPLMYPRLAVVDPELTHTLPSSITATTGLDALTQLVEPFVSSRANPVTDAFCREGLPHAARSLRQAYERGNDVKAREDMSLVSLLGGLALANAGLGAAHGIASVVGGMFPAPHGAVCARLLPYVMEINVRALQERQPGNEALRRYDEVARILTGNDQAKAADGVMWVQGLCAALQIPPLAPYGMTPADLPTVVEKSAVASSTKANPIQLTLDEMRLVLEQAM